MIAPASRVIPRRCPDDASGREPAPRTARDPAYWVEPGTRHTYPMAYPAYCRTREAEETSPPRHRVLRPDVDHYLWRRWREEASSPEVEVFLTFRPEAPLRVRRIVGEILRAIQRGRPASEAIRHVSRRFGIRHTRARKFMTACVLFETRPRQEGVVPLTAAQSSPGSSLAHWI